MYKPAPNAEEFKAQLPVMRQQAIANLKNIFIQPTFDPGNGTKFAFLLDHEYASEKLLDKEFMQSLQQQLECDSLLVGIPKRQTLIATAATIQDEVRFASMMKGYYDQAGQDKITPALFLVTNGDITGMAADAFEMPDELPYAISESVETSNFLVQVITVTNKELLPLVSKSMLNVMQVIMAKKRFGGSVHYLLPPSLPLDAALVSNCNAIIRVIGGSEEMLGLLAKAGLPKANLVFYHNNNVIAPSIVDEKKHDFSDLSKEELISEYYKSHQAFVNSGSAADGDLKKALIIEFMKRHLPLPDVTKPPQNNKPWWKVW